MCLKTECSFELGHQNLDNLLKQGEVVGRIESFVVVQPDPICFALRRGGGEGQKA